MEELLGDTIKTYLPGLTRDYICKKLGISYPTLSRWVLEPLSKRTGEQLNTLAALSSNDEFKAKIMR